MDEPLRLREVIAATVDAYRQHHRMNPRQWQVCHHLLACRTGALGEIDLRCDQCAHPQRHPCSCRDRHCPSCQRQASEQWCERQRADTLDVTYHHVVFTLPEVIHPLVELHPEVIYDQLLKSAWQTLRTFAADPKRLNGKLGATLVLHTWGQTLVRHLHVHCLVPGGALSERGTWKAARSTYLFPVRALSRWFRGHFVRALRERHRAGELERLTDPHSLERCLDALMAKPWVVYSKPAIDRTDSIVAYLARYSHRIALSDRRLIDLRDGQVRLRYKDYRDGDRNKVLTLSGEELLRRFLLHVLPKGFMRIRHYGLLANRHRKANLAKVRQAIGQAQTETQEPENEPSTCPCCGQGHMRLFALRLPSGKVIAVSPKPEAGRRRH